MQCIFCAYKGNIECNKLKGEYVVCSFLPICFGCEILVNMADWKHAFNLISFRT